LGKARDDPTYKNLLMHCACQYMLIILALGRRRQDGQFKAILGYIPRHCLETKQRNTKNIY
jgi:hypothetical protein